MRAFALAVLAGTLCGCVATTGELQAISSGDTGCSPDAISIADYQLHVNTSSWTATCHNNAFFCSGTDQLKDVHCKHEVVTYIPGANEGLRPH